MMDTLEKLRVLIEDSGFETIDSSCLGIRIDSTNSVYLVIDKSCAAKLGIDEKKDKKVIEGDIETDPRPLYLIPYDPSVESDEYAQQAFLNRIHGEILALFGRISTPSRLIVDVDVLLNGATFGLHEIWENTDTRKGLRRKVNNFLGKISTESSQILRRGKDTWVLELANEDDREVILKILEKEMWEGIDEKQALLDRFL